VVSRPVLIFFRPRVEAGLFNFHYPHSISPTTPARHVSTVHRVGLLRAVTDLWSRGWTSGAVRHTFRVVGARLVSPIHRGPVARARAASGVDERPVGLVDSRIRPGRTICPDELRTAAKRAKRFTDTEPRRRKISGHAREGRKQLCAVRCGRQLQAGHPRVSVPEITPRNRSGESLADPAKSPARHLVDDVDGAVRTADPARAGLGTLPRCIQLTSSALRTGRSARRRSISVEGQHCARDDGEVYEYCPGQFRPAEGRRGGTILHPARLVRLIGEFSSV